MFHVEHPTVEEGPASLGAFSQQTLGIRANPVNRQVSQDLGTPSNTRSIETQGQFLAATLHTQHMRMLVTVLEAGDQLKTAAAVSCKRAGFAVSETAPVGKQVDRFKQCGFAGAVLATNQIQPGLKTQLGRFDQTQVFYLQLQQHGQTTKKGANAPLSYPEQAADQRRIGMIT